MQDHDGWTPLHAAAHWGVKEACSILAEALCDMDVRNKLVSKPDPVKGNEIGGWLSRTRLKDSVKWSGLLGREICISGNYGSALHTLSSLPAPLPTQIFCYCNKTTLT